MTEAIAFGFAVVAATAGVSAVVLGLAHLTKPRPAKAPARQEFRRQWQPLPTVEAELFGGPCDGARVSIPAYHPPHVMHNGERYTAYCEAIYMHDPTTRLTGRN
jgi:hypothetical protein